MYRIMSTATYVVTNDASEAVKEQTAVETFDAFGSRGIVSRWKKRTSTTPYPQKNVPFNYVAHCVNVTEF